MGQGKRIPRTYKKAWAENHKLCHGRGSEISRGCEGEKMLNKITDIIRWILAFCVASYIGLYFAWINFLLRNDKFHNITREELRANRKRRKGHEKNSNTL